MKILDAVIRAISPAAVVLAALVCAAATHTAAEGDPEPKNTPTLFMGANLDHLSSHKGQTVSAALAMGHLPAGVL
jgi:hypothetical protein